MPELPEVEIIRRYLEQKLTGRKVERVEVLLPRMIKWPTAGEFEAMITHHKITAVKRRGKYLLLELDHGQILVVHLRMTGRLKYQEDLTSLDQYARILFHLDEGKLIYADTRTLGTLYLIPKSEISRISGLATLGPEPLSPEFSLTYLRQLLSRHKGKIKSLLLDQKALGGLGNIYVDECLALAKIHPCTCPAQLNDSEVQTLYDAINEVIRQGIEHGGTTFRDYVNGEGKKGNHQNYLLAYSRQGQPCQFCGAIIIKEEVAGRGTHYCPVCQKLKK